MAAVHEKRPSSPGWRLSVDIREVSQDVEMERTPDISKVFRGDLDN